MPGKYQIISELASQTARDITSKAERYTDFLVTAANNYKYSFKEQLLIHAQKPDATACAEIETWNRLGRWVNKGTRGIALLVDRDTPYKLRHVFDYSDTNSRAGRVVTLWQMRPQYEEPVKESLQDSFGEVELTADFPHFIMEIAKNAVEDNFSDYLSNLQSVKGDSFLEELDDLNLEVWLKDTLRSSVAYMALVRAGYQPSLYFTRDDFSHIYDFNTIPVISVLGAATSDISEMVIREIAETVKGLEKEEKQSNRTFARDRSSEYHESRNNKTERSYEDGTDLYDAGRLPDPRPDRSGEPEDWEVWNAASDLPPRASGRNLYRDAVGRNAEQPLGGSGRSGQSDDGQADRADEDAQRSDRADEGRRPDEVGSADELDPELGGGSGPERSDLRVSLPSEEEQQELIAEAEAETTSAFAISQEDIDAVLTRGSGIHDGKYRIYEQYLKQETHEANVAFLKDEYGIGGAYPAVPGRQLDENHDGKGIKISRGSIMHPDAEVLLSWKKIEKRIGELIATDQYLSQAEKEHYPAYRAEAEARRGRSAISEEFRSIVYDYNDYVTQLGEENKKLNLYYLSSCWGAFSVGDKRMYARTSDGDFILPMMREAMNTIIADNTHLTERCEAMLTALNSDLARPLEPSYDELNPPPEPEKEYRFSLGDTVYLGTHEYEVLSFDENEVVLYDTQFPLFNKTMTRGEFEDRLKENPLNDHLLHAVEEPQIEATDETAVAVEEPEESVESGPFIDHYYVVEDLSAAPLSVTEYPDREEALEAYFALPVDTMKAFGVVNTKELPGSLDFIQCRDGKDTLIEDYAKTDDDSWRNSEIEGLVDQLKEKLAVRDKPIAPPPQKQRGGKVTPHVLLPEINTDYRTNFRIERDDIGVGTPLERFHHNRMAIQLLKKLEDEHRLADTNEQRILADYVGWGGLSDYFKEDNPHYQELKELLTEDEYASARESTLTAFYTPPVVIKAVYSALENMHFRTGNVLEPSCGIGNFMGLVPESMASAKFYGVELDSISGRIAQQLYQNSSIAVQGFEDTNLPDSFFDAAVGNVPFGQFKVPDKRYDKHNFLIHDYFFARTLDKVRPGGVVAFITSKGTMDKENPAVRKYIAQRADLLGAIRLPNNTFKDAAGTEVTSDIIFLQKRDRLIDIEPEWVHLATDENGIRMNSYFVSNPEMVLGDMQIISGAHGPESACVAYEDAELGYLLQDAIQNIHAEITEFELDDLEAEGTGYRAKTRFAKFYNLPELMAMFKETADIQTADMLKLPVPEAHYHSVVLKPSETQKEMVASLSERAERVRNKMVDSSVDNMLLITNDGRKLALDQRLMNDMLPDSETSKVGACAENVFDIWQRTADQKSTQMVFCDLSTPHGDGKFNVYDDLRNKLIAKGIPAEEIAYIHAANSEAQKKELFGKVRSGQVRVLIGSTQKMGAGTDVQTKLAALHHLDCPWRPSDLQQREGRIIRQGNENKEVDIYTYVTENTFDSYLYQLVESKQKFIGQIMTSKSPVRSAEDIDETALSYAEIKALCAGNPHIKEKMDLDIDVSRLKLLKANHLSQRYALEDQILKEFPQKIKSLEQRIEGYKADIDQLKRNTEPNEDGFSPMIMPGGTVREKKAAGDAILGLCKSMTSPDPIPIGQYRGFDMELSFDTFSREYKITLIHQLRHTVTLGTDIFGNIQRLDNTLGAFEERMAACTEQLENTRVQLENAKAEVQKPFSQEEELKTKSARLNELNAMLNLDKRENEIVDGERGEEEPQKSSADRER